MWEIYLLDLYSADRATSDDLRRSCIVQKEAVSQVRLVVGRVQKTHVNQ